MHSFLLKPSTRSTEEGSSSSRYHILRGWDGCHEVQEELPAGMVAARKAAAPLEHHTTGCNRRLVRQAEGIVRAAGGIVADAQEEGGTGDGRPASSHRSWVAGAVLQAERHSPADAALPARHIPADGRSARELRSLAGGTECRSSAAAACSHQPRVVSRAGRAIRRMGWQPDYASRIGCRMSGVHMSGHRGVHLEEAEGRSCYGQTEGSGARQHVMTASLSDSSRG
jgi:hypothetical protein